MNEDGQLFETKKSVKLFLKLSACAIVAFVLYSAYQSQEKKMHAETSFPQASCANSENKDYPPGYRGLVEVEMRPECFGGYTTLPMDWPHYAFQSTEEKSGYFILFLGDKDPIYTSLTNPVAVGNKMQWYQFCASKNGGVNVKPIWGNEEIHFSGTDAGLESGHCSTPMTATIFRVAGKGRLTFRCVGCAEIPKEPQENEEQNEEEQIPPDDKP